MSHDKSDELKPRKVHSGHSIDHLYCKDCKRDLTLVEAFDMGWNWALSEMEA